MQHMHLINGLAELMHQDREKCSHIVLYKANILDPAAKKVRELQQLNTWHIIRNITLIEYTHARK